MKAYISTLKNYIPKTGFDYVVNIDTMTDVISPSECTEIVLDDTLDYVVDRSTALKQIISLLRYGGTLVLFGTDVEEVAKSIYLKQISVQEGIQLLTKNSLSSLSLMLLELSSLQQLTVINKNYVGHQYHIMVTRNGIN